MLFTATTTIKSKHQSYRLYIIELAQYCGPFWEGRHNIVRRPTTENVIDSKQEELNDTKSAANMKRHHIFHSKIRVLNNSKLP